MFLDIVSLFLRPGLSIKKRTSKSYHIAPIYQNFFTIFFLFVSMTKLLNCVLHWTLGEDEINKLYIKKIGIWNCLTHSCDSIDSCDYYSNGRFSISLYTPLLPIPPVLFSNVQFLIPSPLFFVFLMAFCILYLSRIFERHKASRTRNKIKKYREKKNGGAGELWTKFILFFPFHFARQWNEKEFNYVI